MTTTSPALRRLAAGIGAVALALTGAVTLSTAAYAAPAPGQPQAPESGTLTINKYAGGHTETPSPEDLLDGVEFTATEVGRVSGGACVPLDLADADAWDGLDDLFDSAPAAPASPFCLTTEVFTEVTEDGQAVFNLPVGVYLVTESDPGDNAIVSPVPDFYVSIPMPAAGNDSGWNYNVVTNPKNQLVDQPTKTISEKPESLVVGSEVTWTLTVPVPTFNDPDEKFESATVTDVLDSRLSYADSRVFLDGVQLTEGTDYTVDPDGVTWDFAKSLAALTGKQGTSIVIELDTTVDSVGDGSIPNDDYSSEFNGTTVPGETVPYTYWGQLSIQKNDDTGKGLAGAEFQVFDKTGATCPTDAPASGAVATGTSDATGFVDWAGNDAAANEALGLWVANVDDGPADPTPTKDYCLYETVVPAGHVAGSITNPVTITPGDTNTNLVTVVNPRKDGPDLPLTGAAGTLAMTIGGIAIVLVGAGAMLLSRRRKDHV